MLHFILGLIAASLLIGNAMAVCEPEQMGFMKKSLFFTDDSSVNIPFQNNGKPSCYHPVKKLSIVAESINSKDINFEITPMIVEFENIPEPTAHHYIFSEMDMEDLTQKISMVSFLCSGEIPVGADAFSDSLQRIAEKNGEEKEEGSIFISSGHAAGEISVSNEQKARAKIFDHFRELYELRTNEDVTEDEVSNLYVPNVILAQNDGNKKVYASFFARTSSSINGCSKKFMKVMDDLKIDNAVKNRPFQGIEIKKKMFTDVYRLIWKL